MVEIEQIKDFDQIKIVTDPNRLAILRLLMAGPATLTQLGRVMENTPPGCATTSNNSKQPGWWR